jgi:ribosomal protein S18 acetylase RimI-like enzyme
LGPFARTTMFCSVALAERIERAEQRLVASAVERARRRLPDAFARVIGGGFAAFTEPGSPLNKVVALGFAPFDEGEWAAVEAEHARRAAPLQVELSTLADPALARFLTGRGFRLVAVENVLGLRLAPGRDARVPGDIRIEPVGREQLDAWIDVMVTGSATPDTQGVGVPEQYDRAVIERIMRDFAGAAGIVLFAARRGEVAAGAGAMALGDRIAQLCGAATLPAHRRRGVQSALLAFRLAHAAAAGCELAFVTTQPGSKSMQNVMQQGFHLLYGRNVLRREA